jgi:hypothetical protein
MSVSDDFLKEHLDKLFVAGFEPDPPAFAKLNGWNMLIVQITMADQYLKEFAKPLAEAVDTTDLFRQNAWFVAFLTTYGKCFNSANDRTVTLDANEVFKSDPPVRDIHDRILRLRNAYAAHNSGSGLVHSHLAVKEENGAFLIKHLVTTSLPVDEVESFRRALDMVEDVVIRRLNRHLDRLQEKLGKPVLLAEE